MSATDGCYTFGRSDARGLVLARCVTPLCLLLPLCYLYLLSTCNFIAIAFVLHATFFYQILPDLHSYSSFWQLPYARFRGLILESSLQGPARLPCTHADSGGLLLLPPGPCTLACAQCPAQSASPLSHTLTPEACSSFLQRCVLVVVGVLDLLTCFKLFVNFPGLFHQLAPPLAMAALVAPMDFDVVMPVGQLPGHPASLVARGPDPLCTLPPGSPLILTAGLPLVTPAPGGAAHALAISWIGTAYGMALYIGMPGTNVAGAREVALHSLLPSKLGALEAQLLVDGLPPGPYSNLQSLIEAVWRVVASLPSPPPVAYHLLVGDTYTNEPLTVPVPGPALLRAAHAEFCNGPSALTYDHLTSPSSRGFSIHLSFTEFFLFGKTTAARDQPGSTFRRAHELLASGLVAASGATQTGGPGASMWMERTNPDPRLAFYRQTDSTSPGRRLQAGQDRHDYIFGPVERKSAVMGALLSHPPLSIALPTIQRVIGFSSPSDSIEICVAMLRAVQKSQTALVTCVGDATALEDKVYLLRGALTAPAMLAATAAPWDRARAIITQSSLVAMAGGASLGPASSALGGTSSSAPSGDPFKDKNGQRAGELDFRAVEAALGLALAAVPVIPVQITHILMNSPINALRRYAMGYTSQQINHFRGLSPVLARCDSYVAQWRRSLPLAFVVDQTTFVVTDSRLAKLQTMLSDKFVDWLRSAQVDRIDWLYLAREIEACRLAPELPKPRASGLHDDTNLQDVMWVVQRYSWIMGLPIQPPAAPPLGYMTLSQLFQSYTTDIKEANRRENTLDEFKRADEYFSLGLAEAAFNYESQITNPDPYADVLGSILLAGSASYGAMTTLRQSRTSMQALNHVYPNLSVVNALVSQAGGAAALRQLLASPGAGSSSSALVVAGPTKPGSRPSSRNSEGGKSPERGRSPTPHDGRDRSRSKSAERGLPIRYSNDNERFWFVDRRDKRVTPEYEFKVLEQIAGKSRRELCFEVLMSSRQGTALAMALCKGSGHDHASHTSKAHVPPFADFVQKVNEHYNFKAPSSSFGGPARVESTSSADRSSRRR